jgi:hypothetical protein
MRTLKPTTGFFLAALLLAAVPAAAFDMDLEVKNDISKWAKIEKPTNARDFVDRVVSYQRFVPNPGQGHVFPVFINTHNYLTCPNSDKKVILSDVKRVSWERRRGIAVLGFFFDKPGCEKPTFHMEPIFGDV